jgi:hypothetical protein
MSTASASLQVLQTAPGTASQRRAATARAARSFSALKETIPGRRVWPASSTHCSSAYKGAHAEEFVRIEVCRVTSSDHLYLMGMEATDMTDARRKADQIVADIAAGRFEPTPEDD